MFSSTLAPWFMQVTLNARLVEPMLAPAVERLIRSFFPLPVHFAYDQGEPDEPVLSIQPDLVLKAMAATDPEARHWHALQRDISACLARRDLWPVANC
jgi:hypothetical protein